jgi:hypothetical protein
MAYTRAAEPFQGRVPKLSLNFEEILSLGYGNFEEQNKDLKSSIIITASLLM